MLRLKALELAPHEHETRAKLSELRATQAGERRIGIAGRRGRASEEKSGQASAPAHN